MSFKSNTWSKAPKNRTQEAVDYRKQELLRRSYRRRQKVSHTGQPGVFGVGIGRSAGGPVLLGGGTPS